MSKRKLTPEEQEKVTGGLVVYRGLLKDCYIVDDVTGKKLDHTFLKSRAKKLAREKWGVSDEVISQKEYNKRFNK